MRVELGPGQILLARIGAPLFGAVCGLLSYLFVGAFLAGAAASYAGAAAFVLIASLWLPGEPGQRRAMLSLALLTNTAVVIALALGLVVVFLVLAVAFQA